MNTLAQDSVRFEQFTLVPAQGTLCRDGQVLTLRRQSFEVLRYLVERSGEVVTTEKIATAVWTHEPADPRESVGQCIKEIRRVLGDEARWMIRTVSGQGYEFRAEVVPDRPAATRPSRSTGAALEGAAEAPSDPPGVADPVLAHDVHEPIPAQDHTLVAPRPFAPSMRWRERLRGTLDALQTRRFAGVALLVLLGCAALLWSRPAPAPAAARPMVATSTVAVLPFVALGAKPELDAAAAFTTSFETALARANPFIAFSFRTDTRGGAADLAAVERARHGAHYVASGKYWVESDVHRISVQLLDTDTRKLVWTDQFEFDRTQVGSSVALATRIARHLAQQIRTTESLRPLPERPEAGHFALLGRVLSDQHGSAAQTLEALALFEKALAIDSNSIGALQGLAVSKLRLVHNTWLPAAERAPALAAASAAIDRLLAIDKWDAVGHFLQGSLERARRNPEHAIASFEQALRLNPNHVLAKGELGRVMIDAGRSREALALLEEAFRASATDINSHLWCYSAGLAALHLGDDQTAVRWLIRARQANPGFEHTLQFLAIAHLGLGEDAKARAAIAEYRRAQPHFALTGWRRVWASRNPVVTQQRKRIEDALRRLGVPEEVAAAATRN